MSSTIYDEYSRLKTDTNRVNSYKSASLDDGKRTFMFTTNIKTLSTYLSYIEDVYSKTTAEENDKQKNKSLDKTKFRNPYNHDLTEFKIRSDIVLKAISYFGNKKSPNVYIITWLLLLKVKESDLKRSGNGEEKPFIKMTYTDIYNVLPLSVRYKLSSYIRRIEPRTGYDPRNVFISNPLLASVILYGDDALFEAYAASLRNSEDINDFIDELIADGDSSPIKKRISNFQYSALKEEARYFFLSFLLQESIRLLQLRLLHKQEDNINKILEIFVKEMPTNNESYPDWLMEKPISGRNSLEDLITFFYSELTNEEFNEILHSITLGFGIPFINTDLYA